MLVRVTLAVLACFLLAAAPAGAAIPSSFPGADLVPIRGMAYQPTPSDYQPCGCGVYFDTDFFNDDFSHLWDDANGGRGDLQAMAEQLHVNFLHLYNWNPQRNHLAALNKAVALGIKVAVPISNFFVDPGQDPNAAADIENIMREVYVDQQGNPSTVPHPAVAMILVANEPERGLNNASPSNPDRWQPPVVAAIASTRQAEQNIGATGLLPVSVPFSFEVDNYDTNANNPGGLPAVGQNNSLIAALNAAPALGSDFVKTRFIASGNTQSDGAFMGDWIPQFTQAIPNTPLWFPEQGTGVALSCTGYQNCTPSEQQQAIFNADQFAATKPNTADVVLGGAQFEWVDETWKTPPHNEPTFGIYKYNGTFRTVATAGGTYRVDDLVQKPSWSALRDAFVGSTALAAVEAPPSGGGAADSSTVSSTGGATSSTEPPLSQATPPSNVFTLLRSRLAFNRRRTAVTLTFVAPGPGKFAVRAAGARSARATSVRSHRRTIRRPVKPTTKRATAAGPVRVTVRLTRAAARILADRRRVRVRLRVTFTPDGGTAAVRRVNVTFRKRHR